MTGGQRSDDDNTADSMTVDSTVQSPTTASPAIPAATVVPLRDGPDGLEVLLLRRSTTGSFAGMWVFPGGRVERVDLDQTPMTGERAGAEDLGSVDAARLAAVREANEESSLVLDPAQLVAFSWWLPPEEAARRYATWFFLAPVRGTEPVVVDNGEVHEHLWVRPGDALAQRDNAEIELAPPTWMTLRELSAHVDVDTALAAARASGPRRFVTRAVLDGTRLTAVLWDGDAAYATSPLNLDVAGGRRRLLLDPTGWRFDSTPEAQS